MKRLLVLSSALSLLTVGCTPKAPPMTGAYATAAVADPQVQAAAEFAVQAHAKEASKSTPSRKSSIALVKVVSADQQVVAGMNYRMTLVVSVDGKRRTVEAVVWQQAWRKPNPYELTTWVWK